MLGLPRIFPRFVHAVSNVLASFEASCPDESEGLLLRGADAFGKRTVNGGLFLCMANSGNYYEEDSWGFEITDPDLRQRERLVLELSFLDEGYGFIAARRLTDPSFKGQTVAAVRMVSCARLNTGELRTAAFLFERGPVGDLPADRSHFEITGLQNLHSARLLAPPEESYWEELQSQISSHVEPAVTLKRPMDVVCSAGAEVLNKDGFLERSVANLREQVPLSKALGFNAIEAYVRWDLVEPERGRFDWTIYDRIVEEIERYDLKLFPLLIVGSAYTLPDWFYASEENVGFVCVEHGLECAIQSIWSPFHRAHVTRFLRAFGEHYEPMGCLAGVRLGPSGNYGESQYPASGDWGYKGQKMHLHIGFWAGDAYAVKDFQRTLGEKYGTIRALNESWEESFSSFEEIPMILPEQCLSKRQRLDLLGWYTDSMSDWCEWWAVEARKAMPNTPIYQSAGGWGAAEIGTDYSAQAKSMVQVDGGIRLTNELDSFHQAFYATRLGATAARCYRIPLGFEPAMGHTARGTAGRIFNCVSNGGDHFFVYGGSIFNRQTAIETWLDHYPLFDQTEQPLVEVAVYYPQTMNFLSQDTFRYLNAWGFNPVARKIRDQVEVDYVDGRLILDGFLNRYKALVFAWGNQMEAKVLEAVDAWLRAGGTVIFPYFLNATLATVEGDPSTFQRWSSGDVGKGRFCRYVGDDEPPDLYAEFVRERLLEVRDLSPVVRIALEMERPDKVFLSARERGDLLALNFHDVPAKLSHRAIGTVEMGPYSVKVLCVKQDAESG